MTPLKACGYFDTCKSREREGRDTWCSMKAYVFKRGRFSVQDVELVKSAKYVGMTASGVLVVEANAELDRVLADGGLATWLAGPGELLNVADVQVCGKGHYERNQNRRPIVACDRTHHAG